MSLQPVQVPLLQHRQSSSFALPFPGNGSLKSSKTTPGRERRAGWPATLAQNVGESRDIRLSWRTARPPWRQDRLSQLPKKRLSLKELTHRRIGPVKVEHHDKAVAEKELRELHEAVLVGLARELWVGAVDAQPACPQLY